MTERLRICAARRGDLQQIKFFKLTDGRVISYDDAITMVHDGELKGYNIYTRNCKAYIRDNPDFDTGDTRDNIQSLPEF